MPHIGLPSQQWFEELSSGISTNASVIPLDSLSTSWGLTRPSHLPGFSPVDYLTPPIVGIVDGHYWVIDGAQRIDNLRARGEKEVSVVLLNPPVDSLRAGLLRISLNRFRPQSLPEQVLFLTWLSNCAKITDPDLVSILLGISVQEQRLLLPLIGAGAEIVAAVEEGSLDLARVRDFLLLDGSSQESLLRLVQQFKLSSQTQREFLEWLPEIAQVQGGCVRSVLQSDKVRSIVEDATLNGPQKIQRLREHLFALRFPHFSRTLERWTSVAVRANPIPQAVRFEPSPGFEKRRMVIHATVDSPEGAQKIVQGLGSIPPETWRVLIDPIED